MTLSLLASRESGLLLLLLHHTLRRLPVLHHRTRLTRDLSLQGNELLPSKGPLRTKVVLPGCLRGIRRKLRLRSHWPPAGRLLLHHTVLLRGLILLAGHLPLRLTLLIPLGLHRWLGLGLLRVSRFRARPVAENTGEEVRSMGYSPTAILLGRGVALRSTLPGTALSRNRPRRQATGAGLSGHHPFLLAWRRWTLLPILTL